MAYGFEVIIGFTNEKFKELEKNLNIEIDEEKIEIHNAENLNKKLFEVQVKLIKSLRIDILSENRGSIVINTTEGERKLRHLKIKYHFADDGIGEGDEHKVVGVPISSAYYPSLIDWRYDYGGFQILSLNDGDFGLIKKIKNELIKLNPIFKESKVIIKTKHYWYVFHQSIKKAYWLNRGSEKQCNRT